MADFPAQGNEIQVLRFLEQIDGEAEATKREPAKTWDENMRQWRGDQWRLQRSPYFLANIIKNQGRRKVALLTESKPQIQVRAREPGLEKASGVVYNAIRSIWDRSSMQEAVYRVSQFGMTVGSAFFGIEYDPLQDEIEVSFVDPRRVYLDPAVTSPAELQKAQYLRVDTTLSLAEIRERFPGRGMLVKPDDRLSGYTESRTGRTGIIASVLSAMPRPYRPGTPTKTGPIPRAEIRQYYLRDPSPNSEGGRLFPGGRRVFRAGNVILLDERNPYWDGEWPLEMFSWDLDFESPWGLDEIQDIRRLQEAINRMGDAWVKNSILGSNFKIIADLDALDPDEWGKVDNEAGLVIRKKPQRQFEYVPPTTPSEQTPAAIEGLIRLCDLLTGNSDAQSGPGQRASAMEGLQSARQSLIRDVSRRLESALERVGQKLIARIFQFYTSDRILFQQGPSREWLAYTFKRQELVEDDEGRKIPLEKQQRMFRDFRFLVTPGSSLATTRVQRTLAALQLRTATGVAPSIRRILQEADLGDPDTLIQEGLEELSKLPQPPPPKGRGSRQ